MGDAQEQNDNTVELVLACRNGSARAWQQLVDKYARLVHSVPVRHGLTPQEVDDVGQEVFIALAQHIDDIEHPERLPGWLATTARRFSWRALHKRRQEQPASSLGLSEDERATGEILFQSAPSINELLTGWARQEELQQSMAQLTDRCRQLLFHLFLNVEEPSYEEISELLDIAKGSIGPTRNRCLEQLRARMERFDD